MTKNSLIPGPARQFIYLVVLVLAVLLFWQVADVFKSATVREYGVVENTQSIVLLLAAVSFGMQAWGNREFRHILYCLAMLTLAALVREQDAYLDDIIPLIGWKWCWIFPISGLILIIRQRHSIGPAMRTFQQTHAFHMMVTAVVIIIPVGQCLGHRSFLADMLENDAADAYLVRRMMEEPVELLGYIQILLASLECWIELRKK